MARPVIAREGFRTTLPAITKPPKRPSASLPKPAQEERPYMVYGGTRPRNEPVRLNRDNPSACFDTVRGVQFQITVSGCGVVPSRVRRKRAILEYRAMGKAYALSRWDVTCDGAAVLPKTTDHVRIDLIDLAADVVVQVERRPAGERKKYPPKRWQERRSARPIEGRYRRPKAVI